MKKPLLTALMTFGIVAVGLSAPTAASAATTLTVCSAGCGFSTIQSAVNAAAAGDTIDVVGDLTVAGQTTVNKDVTVTSSTGATVTQTATAITFLLSGDDATLSDLTITSDTPKAREFVQIGGDDVTLSGNTIFGPLQAQPMSGWVGNRGFVTQGGITGFTAADNVIHSLRTGAYLNPNGTGSITGNTLFNTKGDFLIDNANFTFSGNRSGDASQPSEWGFVIFANTAANRYDDLEALSRANNRMTAWDQRSGEQIVRGNATPAARIVERCGAATVELSSTLSADNAVADDVEFTVVVDGASVIYTVEAGETRTLENIFGEDTGDHTITVYAGGSVLDSATIASDCAISNQDECKNGRWIDGGFKNQGQCVSSFAKAKKG